MGIGIGLTDGSGDYVLWSLEVTRLDDGFGAVLQ